MGIIFACSIIVMIFAFILMYRNNIVCASRINATRIAAKYSFKYIEQTRGADSNWKTFYDIYDSYPSYDRMMWNFTAWSFDAFYQNYEDKLKKTMGGFGLQLI